MAALTQTITIVDKSNKVVSASKQLKNVFAEAKLAYLARKAEIKAERKRKEEVELQKAIKACSIAEDEARSQVSASSRARRSDHHTRRRRDGQDSVREHGSRHHKPSASGQHVSLGDFNEQLYGQNRTQPRSAPFPLDPVSNQMLQRRQTDQDLMATRRTANPAPGMARSYSASEIDLDLAYGEFYDSEGEQLNRSGPNALIAKNKEQELTGLVSKCKKLLDEADCAGQSVKAIISHLQENPDAMAAVALTLAEISNVASKMAPGALTVLKGSAPAVLALLASPEFLIAVGLGIGVTVVMFGGYKIIKKIKASAEGQPSAIPMQENAPGTRQLGDQGNELLDVKELDRIENWRRGIAEPDPDIETGSVVSGYSNATSVEGEFITPFAAQSMGHLPLPKDKSKKGKKDKDKYSDKESESSEKRKKHRSRRHRGSERDGAESEGASSERGTMRSSKTKEMGKVQRPSPLRRMLTVQ